MPTLSLDWQRPLNSAAFSPDEQRIVFSRWDGVVRVVDVLWQTPDELAAHARACCLIHELTPDERAHFGLPPRQR